MLKRQLNKKVDWSGPKVDEFRTLYKKKIEGQIDDALLQGVQKIADQLLDNNKKAIINWKKDPAKKLTPRKVDDQLAKQSASLNNKKQIYDSENSFGQDNNKKQPSKPAKIYLGNIDGLNVQTLFDDDEIKESSMEDSLSRSSFLETIRGSSDDKKLTSEKQSSLNSFL